MTLLDCQGHLYWDSGIRNNHKQEMPFMYLYCKILPHQAIDTERDHSSWHVGSWPYQVWTLWESVLFSKNILPFECTLCFAVSFGTNYLIQLITIFLWIWSEWLPHQINTVLISSTGRNRHNCHHVMEGMWLLTTPDLNKHTMPLQVGLYSTI